MNLQKQCYHQYHATTELKELSGSKTKSGELAIFIVKSLDILHKTV